jgi:hypothetical protein
LRAAADRSAAVLFLALRRFWREIAALAVAECPSRPNAPMTARERARRFSMAMASFFAITFRVAPDCFGSSTFSVE